MTSKHGGHAFRVGVARLYACIRMQTPRRPGTHMNARIHARTRKHVHTDKQVILIAFPQQQWFRERASMLRYTYVPCLVFSKVVRSRRQSLLAEDVSSKAASFLAESNNKRNATFSVCSQYGELSVIFEVFRKYSGSSRTVLPLRCSCYLTYPPTKGPRVA
jgi:hypothetical protein